MTGKISYKICLDCGSSFEEKECNNPKYKKKFCSSSCRARYNSRIYFKLYYDRDFKKRQVYFKKWRTINYKHFNNLVLENYRTHREEWDERNYVNKNRDKIIEVIGNKCSNCPSEAQELHHITYDNLPRRDIQAYCKFLIPFCRKCHRAFHKQLRNKQTIEVAQ